MDAKQVFDDAAAGYDAIRRQLIPCFDAFYGTAVELTATAPSAAPKVLDLGAGTGLLAHMVQQRLPNARLTLLDFSDEMLARARTRFAGAPCPVQIRAGDYVAAPLGGPWDAIVSALSIHHLTDKDKRHLYQRVFEALVPGGLFVNADNVLAEDPAGQARDRAAWIAAIRASGFPETELQAALARTQVDILAPLAAQLDWLREAGFVEVSCHYQWHLFAVFAGRRPAK